MNAVAPRAFADWCRTHTSPLNSLDPSATLDDLEPLRDIVGDARVVALGEGAHFVAEFTQLRQRVLRFLVERCGFTVLAFEFGFSEGFALDRWLQGAGEESDLASLSGTSSSGLTPDLARWLRAYNLAGEQPVRFTGVDLPMAAGQLRPALEPLTRYLREVDDEAVPLVEAALAVSDQFTGESVAYAAPRWGRLEASQRNELTASLTRVLLRMRALEPLYVQRAGQPRYDRALREIEAALHTDHMFGAMSGLFAGQGRTADTSVRDAYMADSMLWHLQRAAPDARFVLAAHNNHVQKTPVCFGGELTGFPMGHYLHRDLGGDYRALALTHTGDRVPEMHPDENVDAGFTVAEVPVAAPAAGSVEAGLVDAGFGSALSLTDLREARSAVGAAAMPDSIRTQSASISLPAADAYDGVLSVPTTTTDHVTKLG